MSTAVGSKTRLFPPKSVYILYDVYLNKYIHSYIITTFNIFKLLLQYYYTAKKV